MRFYLGQTVYIPVEDFIDVKWSPIARLYFRVAKCKIEGVPKDSTHQYRLGEIDHKPKKLYYKYAKEIYNTRFGAIKVAEEWAQKEELWNLRYREGEEVYRPWDDSEGTKKELYKLQKTFQKILASTKSNELDYYSDIPRYAFEERREEDDSV